MGIIMTYGFAARLYDRRTGLLSAVLLGVSVEYWYLGHAVITDMTLFVTVSASLMSFMPVMRAAGSGIIIWLLPRPHLPSSIRGRSALRCRDWSS